MNDIAAMSTVRVAIVTGAGSGIGRVSAVALGRDGFTVVCAGRRRDAIEVTRQAVVAGGGTALGVVTDVTEEPSVEALFRQVEGAFGRVDLLFNNAGVSLPPTPLDEVSRSEWERVVATNLTGTFLCTREAFRLMRHQDPQGGRIINNGSISATTPRPLSAAYTATKHAVAGLTKSTALDGRAFNIACGQIDVGNALTEMNPGRSGGEPMMDAADVARAVSYMASLPLDANVLSMTVMATAMPFVGRG
jgi:NAD(P)-dependent dehydrogenase (short-subunit alcohol dehydrogenase family)